LHAIAAVAADGTSVKLSHWYFQEKTKESVNDGPTLPKEALGFFLSILS
jgi:hypothetical protein